MAATLSALTVATLLGPAPAAAAAPENTQPVHDYTTAIRERVWVQTAVDSDADGQPDRVAVRIIRPAATADGLKVPVIFQASPYYGGIRGVAGHDDVDRSGVDYLLGEPAPAKAEPPPPPTFGGYLDNYFVPRGYAVVFADSLGTGRSDGCPTAGGSNEALGMKAVIDWFNGRATAVDADGAPVAADWSTGRTGMIGVSYNGTLPNAVAATGVEGLETIVPIAAVSNWYDYYRANGGVVAPGGYQGEDTDVMARAVLTRATPEICAEVMAGLTRSQDRATGDYNDYWAERNYLNGAGSVRASVFLVHGLHDDNVRTQQTGQWWEALAAHNVPRKIWLHQAGHTDPFAVRRDAWLDALHRWFDQWLYGIDTGIMNEPMADVETAPNQWRTADTWPVPGTRRVVQPLGWGRTRQTFVDNPSRTAAQLVANGTQADPNRLAYLSPPLAKETRLSGTAEVTIRADIRGESPYLTALLVDYGTGVRYAGTRALAEQDCVGPSVSGDSGCFSKQEYATTTTPYEIVTRGWLDVRNRLSLSRSSQVVPGRAYTFRWKLQPTDYVFAPGHRIGLVLLSTERDHTLRYPGGTVIGVRPGGSSLTLPLS
ncbi:Xaa-Pro dipeptidyl-peptidase [Paractinoplanes rishiriensis]|uniref:Xaa-Pro dipeptidyl-peptidase n=1 Tax=Paractinoplanes rishiriensis TaxID=1050105 RepID=A0A919JUV6_9ACTN|nr:Xaa-Pro dipeptidyl-peptidase [Actinoplanes rishiriensis]